MPAVATVVVELENDVAFLAHKDAAIGGAADASFVGHVDGVFIQARFKAVVYIFHIGTYFGIC